MIGMWEGHAERGLQGRAVNTIIRPNALVSRFSAWALCTALAKRCEMGEAVAPSYRLANTCLYPTVPVIMKISVIAPMQP